MDLALLRRRGYFAAIDTELARSLCRTTGEHAPELGLAIALASRQVRRGHVCADLRAFAGRPVTDLDGLPLGSGVWPELGPWVDLLARSELVGDASLDRPLVLDAAGRLYLARYFEHERALAERILSRARPAALERGALRGRLDELLGATANEGQRAAAMIACLGHLTVVTGGPGTGKTTTVVKLLSLLRSLGPMRVLLLAPTGKAAQRLGEVQGAGGKASTIHRALGALGHRPGFVHDRHNPLEADVVVVDESSMVDIALMRRLCDAVPERARLILLGDAHQLASVEAGAVLGDICGRGAGRTWSEALHERARAVFGEPLPTSPGRQVAPLGDSIVELTHSHRFSGQGGIGGVADAIRRADLDRALDLLARADSEARLLELGPPALSGELGRRAVEGYSEYLSAEDPAGALTRLGRFRLLCAHRRGPRGVEFVNDWVERGGAPPGRCGPHRPPTRA
jgi:exodeoxyribonuclease V alpha subunit